MSPFSILLIGLAMSTDAFAAAIGKGVAMGRPRLSDALRTGLIFGVIEAITPVLGWLLGKAAAVYVQAWDHWIAFALLLGLGLHMIANGLARRMRSRTQRPPTTAMPARSGCWP
jgi:Predicted membrane protein